MTETTPTADTGWWTTVGFGGTPTPRGPWHSRADAEDAVARWEERTGSEAGTLLAAHSVRIQGPYSTRAAARDGDISEASV